MNARGNGKLMPCLVISILLLGQDDEETGKG